MTSKARTVQARKHMLSKGSLREGYDTEGDFIYPSPSTLAVMKALDAERDGLDSYLLACQAFIKAEYAKIATKNHAWWDHCAEIYELDLEHNWLWNPRYGRIEPAPQKDKDNGAEVKHG